MYIILNYKYISTDQSNKSYTQRHLSFKYTSPKAFTRDQNHFEIYLKKIPFHIQQIVEKFNRNLPVPASRDIAIRQFLLSENSIFIRFHYAKDAISSSTRTFVKPPKPDYGCETVFSQDDTKSYNVIEWHLINFEPHKINNIFVPVTVRSKRTRTVSGRSVFVVAAIVGCRREGKLGVSFYLRVH